MKHGCQRAAALILALGICLLADTATDAWGALWNKRYVIRQVQGQDILCDPYTVQPNDWLTKLFRQRGEIADVDFPEFLSLFKQINPHVADLDRIETGEFILIPLKKLGPDALPGQKTGAVSIPFATIADPSQDNVQTYTVQAGDVVSRVLARRFGNAGTAPYLAALEKFRSLNPDLSDIDHIRVGQKLRLPPMPLPAKKTAVSQTRPPVTAAAFGAEDVSSVSDDLPMVTDVAEIAGDRAQGLRQIAGLLDARLHQKGAYYFPNADGNALRLDLTRFPIMRLPDPDGRRVLFTPSEAVSTRDVGILRRYWQGLTTVALSAQTENTAGLLDAIFDALMGENELPPLTVSEQGVEVTLESRWLLTVAGTARGFKHCIWPIPASVPGLPPAFVEYMADKGIRLRQVRFGAPAPDQATGNNKPVAIRKGALRAVLRELLPALGYRYDENVKIEFSLADGQANAVTQMVTIPGADSYLIDTGGLSEPAAAALKKTGLRLIRTAAETPPLRAIESILTALDITVETDPVVTIENPLYGSRLAVVYYGLAVSHPQGRTLLTRSVLPPALTGFAASQGITTIWRVQ